MDCNLLGLHLSKDLVMIDPKVGTHYRSVCQCQCVGVGVSAPVFRCVRVSDSVSLVCQCHQRASVSVCQWFPYVIVRM